MATFTVNPASFDNVTSFETIAAAIAAADAGDTITVSDGVYSNVIIDKAITLEAENPGGATITGPGVSQGSAVRIAAGVNNVTVTGFTIEAATGDLAGVYAVGNNSNITISNNTIDGGTAGHAFLSGGAAGQGLNNSTITGNTLLGDGGTGGNSALLYINGSASLGVSALGNSITNNTIEGNPAGGLLMGVESFSTTITGNTFAGNATYAQLEVFGAGNTISGNDFGADGQPFQDGTGTYDSSAIIANNTISGGVIYIEGKAGFYTSLQAAIDAAADGDTISVTPGEYTDTANYNAATNTNSGSNPVGLLVNKSLTIQGVEADGTPITDKADIAATFTSGVQSNWGTNIHVTAPDVTIRGLELLGVDSIGGPANQVVNKVVEVLKGGFVLEASVIGAAAGEMVGANGFGALYINDESVTMPGFLSEIDSFTISGNTIGGSVTIANGAGFGVPEMDLDFTITDNDFTGGTGIGIQGQITGLPWLLAPAQAPTTLTGNSFDPSTTRLIREIESDPAEIQIDRAYIEAFIANNDVGDFAYLLDGMGELKLIPLGGGVYFSAAADDRPGDLGPLQPGESLVTQDGVFEAAATGSTWFVQDGQSLQATITAASAGDTIMVAAGTYDENLSIDKELTIIGPNAGLAGTDDTRAGEAVISGLVTLSGPGAITLDGLKFLNDDPVGARGRIDLVTVASGSDHVITNSVFESEVVGGNTGGLHDVALMINTLASGSVTVTNNLFAGDPDADPAFGAFSTAAWGRGIYSNGGGVETVITGNTFVNNRTGLGLDNYDNDASDVSGNSFIASGSGISIGIPTSGELTTITDNEFTDVGTEFNLGNLTGAVSFDVGGTGNVALEGATPALMNIISGSGDDTIYGTDGVDVITGGNGNDVIHAGPGDVVNGGGGTDIVVLPDGLTPAEFATMTLTNVAAVVFESTPAGTLYVFEGMSIQAAVDAAGDGDTIIVGPGTYDETVLIAGKTGLTLVSADGRGTTILNGSDASGHLGTIQVGAGADDLTVEGFTIRGIDGNGAIEKGAVYVSAANDGLKLIDNELEARGDSGFTQSYGLPFTNATFDGNIFSGQTFVGENPQSPFSAQFDVGNNVPRQLVVIGNGGSGPVAASNVIFINNTLSGTTGGISSVTGLPFGNVLVTIDASDSTIEGNLFVGDTGTTTTAALRVRRDGTDIEGNTFDMSGGGEFALPNSIFRQNNTTGSEGPNVFINADGVQIFPGSAGSEVLIGTEDGDIFLASGGNDSIDGLGGDDTLDMAAAGSGGSFVDLVSGLAFSTATGIDSLTSIENLRGSAGNDGLYGDTGDNTFFASAGNDIIDGRGGSDTYDASTVTADMAVNLTAGTATGAGTDTLSNIENVKTGSGSDQITGSSADNTIATGAGDDEIALVGGTDVVDGGEGYDVVTFSKARDAYTITWDGTTATVDDGEGHMASITNAGQLVFDDGVTQSSVFLVATTSEEYASIQSAIDAADDGDDILVAAGSYEGAVTVNKGVTLIGANAGVVAHDAARGSAESAIQGNVVVTADGATLDGFTLTKPDAATSVNGTNFSGWNGINLEVLADGVTIENTIVEAFGAGGGFAGSGFVRLGGESTFEGNVVQAGTGYDAANDARGVSSVWINAGTDDAVTVSNNHLLVSTNVTATPNDADGLFLNNAGATVIDGNLISGTDGGFVAFGNYGPLTLSGNTIENFADTGIRIFESSAAVKPDVVLNDNTVTGGNAILVQGTVQLGDEIGGSGFPQVLANFLEVPAIYRANSLDGDYGVVANGNLSLYVDQADAIAAAGATGVIWNFAEEQFQVFDGMSIQAAVDAAAAGDSIVVGVGAYGETVTIDKQVEISGAGDTTVIMGGVDITASGADASNRLVLENVKVINPSGDGIDIGAQDFITLSGVTVEGLPGFSNAIDINFAGEAEDILITGSTFNLAAGQIGLKISDQAAVTNLQVEDSTFNGGQYGFYFANDTAGSGDTVTGSFSGLDFNGQSNLGGDGFRGIGIYAEKLSDASMSDITVTAMGTGSNQNIRGINLNLKNGSFENITLGNIALSGFDEAQTPSAYNPLLVVGVKPGASLDGLVLDGITGEKGTGFTGNGQIVLDIFHEAYPAQIADVTLTGSTLTGLVKLQTSDYSEISDNTIMGDLELVLVDQPAAPDNALTTNIVSGSITFTDGRDAVLPEGADNLTLFNGTLIGAADDNQSATGNAGDNVITGNDGNNTLDGGAGADALYGGAGDDLLNVDTDDTVIDGGDGADTAVFAAGTDVAAVLAMEASFTDVEVIRIGEPGSATFVVFEGMSIQAAITAAADGDTIVVGAGEFTENLTVNKELSFQGANEGLAGDDAGRGTESAITGVIDVQAAGVVIDGLQVLQGGAILGQNAGLYVRGTASDLSVTNTAFEREGGFGTFRGVLTESGSVAGLSVTNSAFAGWATGIYLNPGAADATVTGNVFDGNNVGMSLDGPGSGDVSGNDFANSSFEHVGVGGLGATVDAGAILGANTFDAGVEAVTIYGLDAGGQTITGTVNDDLILGGAGNDDITGGDGADKLLGGAGDDVLRADTDDTEIDGGDGLDMAAFAAGTDVADVEAMESVFENIELVRIGDSGSATFLVFDGMSLTDAADAAMAGDTILLADTITTLDLSGTAADATVSLPDGEASSTDIATVLFGSNVVDVIGSSGNDTITGDAQDNGLAGGDGDDVILGSLGNDVLNGGDGFDTVSYAASTANVFASLQLGSAFGDDIGSDTLINIEALIGGSGNDVLFASGTGSRLEGGAGNDSLVGGLGNDTLIAGAGNDTLTGGGGTDTAVFEFAVTDYTITRSGTTYTIVKDGETDTVSGVELFVFDGVTYDVTGDPDLIVGVAPAIVSITEEAPDEDADPDTITVDENSAAATVVATVTASDANILGFGDELTFTLEDGAGDPLMGPFEVVKTGDTTAEIRVTGALDFETLDSYEVTVRITDAQGLSVTEVVTIDVNDVNEAPTDITFGNVSAGLPDDTEGAIVTTVAVVDPDAGDSFTFETDNAQFEVVEFPSGSGTFVLKLKEGETVSFLDGDELTIAVTATDAGGLEVTREITFEVTDTNLPPGGGAGLGIWSPDPVEAGSRRAVLAPEAGVTDPEDDDLTYTLAEAPSAGRFFLGETEVTVGMALTEADLEALVYEAPETDGSYTASFDVFDGTSTVPLNVALTVSPGVDELITGTPGDDVLDGAAGNDTIAGGAGADTLFGGSGSDTLDYSADSAGVAVRLWNGSAMGGDAAGDVYSGFENLTGGSGNDTLNGDNGANVLTGGAGNDFLFAVGGDDLVHGGDGHDTLYGGAGADTLYGGAGDDLFYGGAGADAMYGGDGTDTLRYSDDPAGVTVNLATGTGSGGTAEGDTFEGFENVIGGAGDDRLTGDAGNNLLEGGAGNDTLAGGAGADTMYGGAGIDTLDYSGSASSVQVRLWNQSAFGGDAEGDVYSGIENLIGGSANDTLNGDNGANVLTGGEGDDFLFAVGGDDLVFGGGGNDTLYGGAGDDTLEGGAGNDRLYGDGGADVFVFDLGHGQDSILGFSVAEDRLDLASALVGGLATGADVVANYASVTGAGVTFNFGDGNSILLQGVTSLTGLEDRIDIFGDMLL